MPDKPTNENHQSDLLQQMLKDARQDHTNETHRDPEPPPIPLEIRVAETKQLSKRDMLIADIDDKVSAQVAELLRHPDVARLRAAWTNLAYLVEHIDFEGGVCLAFLNCSKADLAADFEDAVDVTVSGLYRRLCEPEHLPDDGAPVSLVVAQYELGHHQYDVELLRQCAAAASDGHCPFIANASPKFFGCNHFTDMAELGDLARYFDTTRFAAWDSFRDTEDARYVALCVPAHIDFAYLGSFALAIEIAEAFASRRSFERLSDSPGFASETGDAGLTEQQLLDVTAEGLVALRARADGTGAAFEATSAQKPKRFADTQEGRLLARCAVAGAQLSNVLRISRLAHFVEALARGLGVSRGAQSLEHVLQARLDECEQGASVDVSEGEYLRYVLTLQVPGEPPGTVLQVAGALGGPS